MPRTTTPRTYTPTEALDAVTQLRIDHPELPAPDSVLHLDSRERLPEVELAPATPHDVQAWAEHLDLSSTTIRGLVHGYARLRVEGATPAGPIIAVTALVQAPHLELDEGEIRFLGGLEGLRDITE